ncbi:transmembrane sensor/regulator PpyR [Pseudomonas chlororaphis]|uniref:transmembrane sensor/regulator PpyR n=1 Tax=Pseudomonas chlororaphis TaxID=587753 RepID=UPI00209ABD1C|nr:transmembrane sensor/regulator PpyR [Pseudomonas chlororaphis]MCO7573696.1 transmembrane sensor/regulator PpyR [Pseudomonas chlororaphis]MCO7592072.1 transmembrane sensor/regulator PpyR [Pseudomonas chlororaphis]
MSRYFDSPLQVLQLSSAFLWLGSLLFSLGVYAAYFHPGHLPIASLVLMHSLVIIGPTLLKIGYVMRLLAQRRLARCQGRAACVFA